MDVFSGKYGLITLRDLFRWAQRYKKVDVYQQFHDWEQHLAEDGNPGDSVDKNRFN